MIGTTIGSYRIESEAGAGGMGIVYRAVDVQLKRPVALKVLNAAALTDPDRKRRFVQEAQAASALNHPGIVTIYQIGTDGATDFIAMEFVAGRSLDQVVAGRPLALADVVKFGAHIAGALAAAHHAGIVHRDLKPANVMVTEKGGIKLLDFGVAKLVEPTTAETALTSATNTRTGLVIGTLAYMSPEQARGEKIDARSDIYAFGVVLHEMIGGRRPPEGAAAFPDSTPRDLRRIVTRCLQIDRDERFQSIDDVRMALEDADIGPAGAASTVAGPTRGRRILRIATTAGLIAVAAGLAWRLKPMPPASRTPILTQLTMDSGLTADPVLSPDGRLIAFASDRSGDGNLDIWLRQVAGGEPVRLTNSPADDLEPSFSHDASRLAFRSERDGGGIYVISALGGDARRIVDQGRRPRWGPKTEQIVYWTGLNTGFLISNADAPRVFVVAATGGEPQRLFPDFAVASYPTWSADGTHLLFLGCRGVQDPSDWWVANADGSSPVKTGAGATIARAGLTPPFEGLLIPDAWSADGGVVFSAHLGDSTNIWSLTISPDGQARGAPARLTAGTGIENGATIDGNGVVAFAAVTNDIDLWSLALSPDTGAPVGTMQRLTHDPASDLSPWLSPDGRSLAFTSNRSGTFDVWVRDLATGKEALVAPQITYPSLPTFTKSGGRITFQSAKRGMWMSVPLAGETSRSGVPQVVCADCPQFWDLSSDDQWALYGTDKDTRIMARNTATGATTEFLYAGGAIMGRLRISPDDRWVSFNYREGGSIRIMVVPFLPGTQVGRERWIAMTPEDTLVIAPTWSLDSGTLYYLSNRDGGFCVWAQPIDRQTGRPRGDAVGVWHFHDARLSTTRMPLPARSVGVARDRLVVSVGEGAGNIWLAR